MQSYVYHTHTHTHSQLYALLNRSYDYAVTDAQPCLKLFITFLNGHSIFVVLSISAIQKAQKIDL